MPRLNLVDHNIFYEITGKGPPVVLLHHATAGLGNWRNQVGALTAVGYQVITYDRHGFGKADPLPSWSLDYHQDGVEELLALLDALDLDRVALLGHSDGAAISLMAAAQHPQRIAAVIAEAPHLWVEPDWLETGFETFRTTVGSSERFWKALHRDHGDRAEEVVQRWRTRWLDPAFSTWDASPCLPDVACPVLVIHGAKDTFFPISHSQRIAETVQDSEFWLLDGIGHTPHLEAKAPFNRRVIAFLDCKYPISHDI